MKRNKKSGQKLHLPLLISCTCLLLTFLVWDRYFNADVTFNQYLASSIILLMGTMFSVMVGLFMWSMEKNLSYAEQAHQAVQNIIRSMSAPLIITDEKGVIKNVNQALLDMIRTEEKGLVGRTIQNILGHAQWTSAAIEKILNKGFYKQSEQEFITEDGKVIPVLFSGAVLKDSRDKLYGIVFVAQDISERKMMESQLYQADQMQAIGRLASGIAHDFKNVLIVISGYCRVLLDELAAADAKRHEIQKINELTLKGTKLVQQLLALSGKHTSEPKVLNLNELVLNIEHLMKNFLGEGSELITTIEAEPYWVKVDAGQIEQMLMNLVVNAQDAMPNGGTIRIAVKNKITVSEDAGKYLGLKGGDYAVLQVTDTGIGMTEEIKKHIFEPYFTTKSRGQGTGLGLATVYGIVKQANGNIQVYSKPNQGTLFDIYLPIVEAPKG